MAIFSKFFNFIIHRHFKHLKVNKIKYQEVQFNPVTKKGYLVNHQDSPNRFNNFQTVKINHSDQKSR